MAAQREELFEEKLTSVSVVDQEPVLDRADEAETPLLLPAEEAETGSRLLKPFVALQERDFRNLWIANLPGTLAMQMGMITTGYLAFELTGSAAAVGLVTLGWGVPMLLFALIGGVAADRFSKRQILLVFRSVIVLTSLTLAVLTISGVIQIWMMTLVAFIMGTAFAFNMPAQQSFVAELVSRKRLTNAIALQNSGMNASRIIGPSLAGGLISLSFVGVGGVFVIMTLMNAAVVINLYRIPDRGVNATAKNRGGFTSLVDGLKYIRANSVVRSLLILAFAVVALGLPYQSLMPVFAKEVFGVGAAGLGLLMTLIGIGALAGSLTIAAMSDFDRRGMLQVVLGVMFGLSLAVFAFSQNIFLAVLVLPIVGAASAAYHALNSSLTMDNTKPEFHGRVMSVYMLTFALMPLSVLPFGIITDQFGAPVTVGVAALLLAAIVVAFALTNPKFRQIR